MKQTLLTIGSCIAILQANAAVIYTEVNPNFTETVVTMPIAPQGFNSNASFYGIDLDDNGTEDFNFRWDYAPANAWQQGVPATDSYYFHMTASGSNEFILKGTGTNTFGGRYLQALSAGTEIGPNVPGGTPWGTSFPEPFIGDTEDTNFEGLGDQYIGVRFDISGSTHYGWVLVSFDSNLTLTVKGFAYEDTAGTPITAGDTGSTANLTELEANVSVWPNPATSELNLTADNGTVSNIAIYNLSGALVLEQAMATSNAVSVADLENGLYTIVLKTAEGNSITKKIVKH